MKPNTHKPEDDGYDWDIEDSEYLYFGDGDRNTVIFRDEGVRAIDDYKNECVDFEVDADGVECFWRVTSARVRRILKKARPLTGKTFEIARQGEKFETRYTLKDVSNVQQFTGDDE